MLVLARAGVLGATRTTCLTKAMERGAYLLTSWKLGRYYRTYPAYVEDEVVAALDDRAQFERGPLATQPFVVEDGRYVSGRWPGDANLFAQRFEALLSAGPRPQRGGRDSSASDVIVSAPRAASSRTSVASSAERA